MDKDISTYKWCTECKRETKHGGSSHTYSVCANGYVDGRWCEKCTSKDEGYIKIYCKIYIFLMLISTYYLSTFTNTPLLEAFQYSLILMTAIWWVGLPIMFIIISVISWVFSK